MRYDPFNKSFDSITGEDLAVLRTTSEGWYVEYKSELIPTKTLAKSLSAFANHYGGWLFLGVQETGGAASSFPGLDATEVPHAVEQLRNASKDCVNPSVFYEHKVITGPVNTIGLPAGRAVVIAMIPLGHSAPYIHNDGRIYRRVADASAPKMETDRAVLDALWKRGRGARKALKKLLMRSPRVSQEESKFPFLCLFISHDPLSQSGRSHFLEFDKFADIVRGGDLPFDNIFAHSGGYTARQTADNDGYRRLLTWEFSFRGHSRITLPVSCTSSRLIEFFGSYEQFGSFHARLTKANASAPPIVLDLNLLFSLMGAVCQKHRKLLAPQAGPFFAKVRLENVWRCVPYLDTGAFASFTAQYGIPIVQTTKVLAPPGTAPESLLVLEKRDTTDDPKGWISDSIVLTASVFHALGVPSDVVVASGGEFAHLLDRAKGAQRHRSSTSW